jgi:hypothetical protein
MTFSEPSLVRMAKAMGRQTRVVELETIVAVTFSDASAVRQSSVPSSDFCGAVWA